MSNFVPKEVPTGAIDGSNKNYLLANDIAKIDDVWIDGAVYTGLINASGKSVVVGDAPTVSIFIDYYILT